MKKPAATKPQHIVENDSDAMKSARCNRLPVQTVLVGTGVFVINKTRCIPVGCVPSAGLGGGHPVGCLPDPPCEENDRRLSKHYLAATSLWTVIVHVDKYIIRTLILSSFFFPCSSQTHRRRILNLYPHKHGQFRN